MEKSIYDSITSNLSKGVARVHKNFDLYLALDDQERGAFRERVQNYAPKNGAATTKDELIRMIDSISAIEEAFEEKVEDKNIVKEGVSQSTAEKIAKQTCVLEIHRHEPGYNKKVNSTELLSATQNDHQIDPSRLSITKALIDRKELSNLRKHRIAFFQSIKDMSLPGGLLTLGNGQFLIPVTLVKTAREKIDKYLSERDELLDDFESRYNEIIEKSKERLGILFDAADYPPFNILRSSYSTSYKFISNNVPEEFERISKEIYEQEKTRILTECSSVSGLIQDSLRERFLDLIAHLNDKLTPDETTGKTKRFYGSNIEHLKEFISTFSDMNLTGDGDLSDLVKQSEALLEGIDVTRVRSDDEFRSELEKGFNNIKQAADLLVVDRKRKVILED